MPSGLFKKKNHQFKAKELRRTMTEAEQRLWYFLRGHRFADIKFKRQVPIGPYIVDFVALNKKLIIELDGGLHLDNIEADEKRTAYLNAQGFRVIRFWNDDVFIHTQPILEEILDHLQQ